MSSITGAIHASTWVYFTRRLSVVLFLSPKVVKEVIMADINDLVQEFWRTLSDQDVGASFYAMRRLFEILQGCLNLFEKVCFDIIQVSDCCRFS